MIPIPVPPIRSVAAAQHSPTDRDASLLKAAQKLEATFLAELLKSVRFGEVDDPFSNAGSQQFASFLTDAHADNMVEAGGIGLAEALFKALTERTDAAA